MKTTERIPLTEVHVDTTLYPRAIAEADWRTVTNYKQAMAAGANFPPIVVAHVDRKLTLIDGRHRLEAERALKHQTIKVQVLPELTREQAFVEAVRRNLLHGRPLSFRDKMEAAKRLVGWRFNRDRISELLQIPVNDLKRYQVSRIVLSRTGRQTVPKPAVSHMAEPPDSAETTHIGGDTQLQLVRQLTQILENGWADLKNQSLRKALVNLKRLLGAIPLPRAR